MIRFKDSVLFSSGRADLSEDRAINATKVLVDSKGIAEERISVSGFGENQAIDTNARPEGRANNRKIEITILN